ncbi:MAG: pirin [Gammaproteobacteria bacterium SG8_47]|nr:MAG: pirin [Gammaproteobacteria bacterium SG8_47]
MTERKVKQLVGAMAVSEGAGVTVHRSIGLPALRHLDPFLMLDHFSSDDPDDYIAGFPDHPHRGFITFTYMLAGRMEHRDSMGNSGVITAGGVQWMKAASGVIHSEMPKQTDGLMQGFQLWINLPAQHKMSEPAYQEHPADRIPEVVDDGTRVKVVAGRYGDTVAPVQDATTQLTYLHAQVPAGGVWSCPTLADASVFAYVYDGDAEVAQTKIPAHQLAVFGSGDQIRLHAGEQGARLIVVAGKPIGEPIVQYGPFVMNTREEIHDAFTDYERGRLVRHKARVNSTA